MINFAAAEYKYGMWYETLLSFIIGALAVTLCGWLFSLKTKGILRLLLNTATGALLITILAIFTPLGVKLNPLTALTVGILGIPGAALITVITCFL